MNEPTLTPTDLVATKPTTAYTKALVHSIDQGMTTTYVVNSICCYLAYFKKRSSIF